MKGLFAIIILHDLDPNPYIYPESDVSNVTLLCLRACILKTKIQIRSVGCLSNPNGIFLNC